MTIDNLIAFVALFVGTATLVFHVLRAMGRKVPARLFRKLPAMEERFGRAGTALHVGAYGVLPVIVGIVLLLAGGLAR